MRLGHDDDEGNWSVQEHATSVTLFHSSWNKLLGVIYNELEEDSLTCSPGRPKMAGMKGMADRLIITAEGFLRSKAS